ncbi:unnamed protein product [Schistosoma margrebowiei]|uniref:Dynein light intermediate chain n=1 Tax=Schistosoma margrebowiei TaxID=48269 RepID=A0AA84Z9F6_9TREM|nr:unnamed protein product [Schistosoma margrebowiei]
MCEKVLNRETETAKCLWSRLLDEVTNKAKVGLSDSKNLVVFGDDQCGKSTLICRLQGNEDKREGFGLEYYIIEVKDELKDVSANLSVSIIDGNPIQSYLLKYVMTEDSFNDQMVIIVVSINEPWKIIEALQKWAEILNKHINKLKLSKEMIKACKSRISKEFYGYAEPDASTNDIINPVNLASLSTMYATSQETTPQLSFLNDNESFTEEMYEDNVLNNNLGVPLIVVVTKTDLMKIMIKENQFTEEHFDFIQMHIRRFCLSYGAALFYVSVKEDKNCDLLNRYIRHRIYGFPFSQSAYIVEGDCIFIPAGWDNHKKINILGENLTKINAQHPFSTVIPRPVPRKAIHREPEIMAIDEQAFLLRLSTIKENENIDPNMLKELLGSGGLPSNSKQPTNSFKIGSGAKTMDDNSRLPVSPIPVFRTKISPVGPTNNLTSTPSIQGTSDGVLADFFSNLLKKRPVVNNTTGETSTEPQLQRTSLSSDQRDKQQDNMDTSVKCSRNSIDEDGEKLFTIGITEKHTEYAKVETDLKDITKQNEYTGIIHEKVENQRDETTNNASGKQEKDEDQKKQQEEITKRKQTKIMEGKNEREDSKNILSHRENIPPKTENTKTELKETIHHDHQNQNKTPTELTEKIDELDSAQKFDVPLVACMSASKAHLDPITDQPPVVELSQTSDNLTDHIDTEHLNDQLNTSPDNTNPTDLNDEINEVNSAPNSESTIVPSHISPMLGHTSETSITTIRSDTITEGRSDEDHELPETSHQDLQNQNKTPTELTEKIDELDSAQKFDVPLVACMSASKAHLDPITDQPPVVELSQTSDNLTDHIDTEHLNDQLNTSPDNTNPTGLNDEINEVNSAPNSESTIVPSHISPMLGHTSETSITTIRSDTITEGRSDEDHELPETSHQDLQNQNKTPTELTEKIDELDSAQKFDVPLVACMSASKAHLDPITDQPPVVELSQTSDNLTDHIDTEHLNDQLNTSPDNTNPTDLNDEFNEVNSAPNSESTIVPSHISPMLGHTSETSITTIRSDTITEGRSDEDHELPETSHQDLQNQNKTPTELTEKIDELDSAQKFDVPLVACMSASKAHLDPITDQPPVVELSQTSDNLTDHIDTEHLNDQLNTSPDNTNPTGLNDEINEVNSAPNSESTIVPSHISPMLGHTSETSITTIRSDTITEGRSDEDHELPETSHQDLQNQNKTPTELTEKIDELDSAQKFDVPLVACMSASKAHLDPITDQPPVVELSQTSDNLTDHIDTEHLNDQLNTSPDNTNPTDLNDEINEVNSAPNSESTIVPSHISPMLGHTSETSITTIRSDTITEGRSDEDHELPETSHQDLQNQNKTPTELTEKIDELDSAQKFDVPLVACMSASKAHLDPITDQPPVVELSQTSDNLTDHIDTEHLNDQLNTSPDNTNPTGLNDEINEVNSAPNSESTIVPSHISPMLGHTSETSITTIRSDTITEGRSDEDHELPETSHQDLQNQNKTPTELTEKIDELDSAQKFDVPLVACMSASKAHLDPITDQPPVVELSQTSDNLTDHIDTEHLNDQLNTSPDSTNPTDLNDEINEVNSAPNSESTIVPSHISPMLGHTSETSITTIRSDTITEGRSDEDHELPETSHQDLQNQNKTPTELTEKIDELDSAQKFDVPLVACMSASKAHLDPITDQPPVVELSQTSDNLTDHIDTEHLNDQLNTSPDNTNPTGLNDEINEVNSAPNSESTIVPSHISPMLGHTSETSITTIRSDTITEGRSDEDHELPETSHQDLQNQNKTPTELTEKIDELDSAQKFDVPLVACMSASKAHLDPITDQPPVVELSQTSDNLTDHIDTEHLNDQLNTSPDNTNPTGLNDEINEVNSAPNSESTIVPSHISPMLGHTSETSITTIRSDTITEGRSDEDHELPETSHQDLQNQNKTPTELTEKIDELDSAQKFDVPLVACMNNLTDHIDTEHLNDQLNTSPDSTNPTDLNDEINEVNSAPNSESTIVPSHISPLLVTNSDIVNSLFPDTNNSYVGLPDILANENNVAVLPNVAISVSDSTSTVLVDAGYSENISSNGNSILSEDFSKTVTSPTNEGITSRASSAINSPLSIQKSLESIKVHSRLKPSSYTNTTIQKNNSLPPSPKLLQKPTVKQNISGSQRSPTMTGPNFGQTNNLTNTKTKYASSTSANASPNLIRKPLSSLSKNTDIKK